MTIDETSRVLQRLHGELVAEIRAKRPEYLEGPFTVAEIYQNLVPYNTHRDRIGVEMNGDYEDALLRLLAGQGEYVVLDSEPALRRLREELASPNPDTGLFRQFAAVDVRLNPEHVPSGPLSGSPGAPEGEGASASPTSDGTPRVSPETGPTADAAGDFPATCPWCRAELPARPKLNFCPFCGTDVHVVPCPECGAELEPDWRFCIACGTQVHG